MCFEKTIYIRKLNNQTMNYLHLIGNFLFQLIYILKYLSMHLIPIKILSYHLY